jgi:hypothetical protein
VTGFTTARQEQVERAGASGETRRSVERLALSKAEAAEALGVSVDFLEEHVMGELRIVPPRPPAIDPAQRAAALARRVLRAYVEPMTPTRKRSTRAARAPGIEIRHSRGCPAASDGPCTCAPTFRAIVYSQRDARKIQQTFPTLSAAKIWRQDALVDLRRGKLRATPSATLREVAEQWLQDAAAGTVLNRSGDRYKPSVVRGYEQALRTYVLPDLGAVQLGALQRRDVQALAERIARSGKSPSTVRNALLPLRAICRRALARGEIHDNPTRGLELPAVRGRRDRIAEPREAAALLSALETKDRRLWATAIYAGRRRGELQALRWGDVDLDASVIRVRRSWDRVAGEIEPKSAAGTRAVPVPALLRPHLEPAGTKQDLVFGRASDRPFEP